MPKDAKTVKVFTLIALLLGLVTAIAGIVQLVQGVEEPAPLLTLCAGIVTLVLAARESMLANVPNNASKVFKLGILAALINGAVCGASYAVGAQTSVLVVVCLAASAFASLLVAVFARAVVKRLERA